MPNFADAKSDLHERKQRFGFAAFEVGSDFKSQAIIAFDERLGLLFIERIERVRAPIGAGDGDADRMPFAIVMALQTHRNSARARTRHNIENVSCDALHNLARQNVVVFGMARKISRHKRALRHDCQIVLARALNYKLTERRTDALPFDWGRHENVSHRHLRAIEFVLRDGSLAVLDGFKLVCVGVARNVHLENRPSKFAISNPKIAVRYSIIMPISAAILAAGTSSRLGQPKQLLRLHGETLIRRTAKTVIEANVARVLVIIGDSSHAAAMHDELRDLSVEIVINSHWREGMASSVRAAVAASGQADALLLTPCDLPLLSASHLRALIEKYQSETAPIVASRYNETLGAPLIIARELWPELLQLRGDVGARRVIMKHDANFIEWPDGAFDVDTRADWQKLGNEL